MTEDKARIAALGSLIADLYSQVVAAQNENAELRAALEQARQPAAPVEASQ